LAVAHQLQLDFPKSLRALRIKKIEIGPANDALRAAPEAASERVAHPEKSTLAIFKIEVISGGLKK
jgi:hypothetical protein